MEIKKILSQTATIINSARSHTDEQLVVSELNLIQENLDKIKEYIEEIEEERDVWEAIGENKWNRTYAKKYLKEQRKKWKKENPERALLGDGLLYPDSESIFKDYYLLRDKLDKSIEYIKKNEEKSYAFNYEYGLTDEEIEELLDILRGEDNELE